MPCNTHSATIIVTITELAPRTKPHSRPSTERISMTSRGHWYGGRLIANGSGFRPRNFVCRSSRPTSRITATDSTYMRNTTDPAWLRKKA